MIAIDAPAIVRLMECPGVTLASKYLEPIKEAMLRAEINTELRAAHFFAQVGHECGGLRYAKELGADPGAKYEGRRDLGNTSPGDGRKYPGRGLMQTTGKTNYLAYGIWRGVGDLFLREPQKLEEPYDAALSAAWFWTANKLVAVPDADKGETMLANVKGGSGRPDKTITVNRTQFRLRVKINGGTNGLEDCQRRLVNNKNVLGVK